VGGSLAHIKSNLIGGGRERPPFAWRGAIKYRPFGKTGREVSLLGLALGNVPPDAVEAVLRAALARGVTYLEIGRHDDAAREEAVSRLAGKLIGEAGADVFITASLGPAHFTRGFDLKGWLRERAGWLGGRAPDGLDFAGLDRTVWPRLREAGLLAAAGPARHPGFSFYDQTLYLRPVLREFGGWAFCRVNASFMDADRLPGATGLINAAAEAGLAVVAAEPLLEGRLVGNIPPAVAELWGDRSPREYALRWVRDAYRSLRPVPCTTCRACLPCPRGIDAPRIFELYNDAAMYGDRAYARAACAREGHDAGLCDECRDCARRCGRHIDIPARVREAAAYLAGPGA
jgi:predicted aldo/keto reductase-like oxidoreductase